jgi:uncharacterized repeat protein (TIGR03803 family)
LPVALLALALRVAVAGPDARAAGDIEVLHAFSGADGAWSRGSLVRDGTVLYGRTAIGGAANSGTIFRIDEDGGGFAVLHSFSAGGSNGDGNQPRHNAMLVHGDTLIGSALYGGNQHSGADRGPSTHPVGAPVTSQVGNGTLFTIHTDGSSYRVLHSFDGGQTPSLPHSPPALAPDGHTLYGLSSLGGAHGKGTLYALDVDGSGFRVLRSFASYDGDRPHGVVTQDGDGNLFGITRSGGTTPHGKGAGVIFRYELATGAYHVLHTFVTGAPGDGATNDHGFLALVDGVAYGTTSFGGAAGAGIVFAIHVDGSGFAIVHSFGITPGDGARPYGSLVALGGWLYGTTTRGGASGDGTLFRVRAADRRYELLASFDRRTSGAFPEDNVVPSADGKALFGLTQAGGVHDRAAKSYYGTVFRVAVPPEP